VWNQIIENRIFLPPNSRFAVRKRCLKIVETSIYIICVAALPSSRFVPAMNGSRANFPSAQSLEGKSGIRPEAPSSVGIQGNNSPALAVAILEAVRSVLEFAA
jgi:hypothetical protein